MAGLVRKSFLVDPDKVSALAHRRGIGESEAIREAVEFALSADEALAALRELRDLGGLDDAFGRLPAETEAQPATP